MSAARAVLFVFSLILASCANARPPALADDAGLPIRGGTLKLVGASDLDHLATTSSYSSNGVWFVHTYSRQLVTYPAASDFDIASNVVADLAETTPTTENGGITDDGRTYTFHLRHGVWWNSSPRREVVAGDVVRGMKFDLQSGEPFRSTRILPVDDCWNAGILRRIWEGLRCGCGHS